MTQAIDGTTNTTKRTVIRTIRTKVGISTTGRMEQRLERRHIPNDVVTHWFDGNYGSGLTHILEPNDPNALPHHGVTGGWREKDLGI